MGTFAQGHVRKSAGLFRGVRVRVRQIEFPPTIEADPISAVLDREHPTLVTMSAANDKLQNPE
jgi:hypothetical protein